MVPETVASGFLHRAVYAVLVRARKSVLFARKDLCPRVFCIPELAHIIKDLLGSFCISEIKICRHMCMLRVMQYACNMHVHMCSKVHGLRMG